MNYFNDLRKIDDWKGHVQIYATNRLITFYFKHKLDDDKLISDLGSKKQVPAVGAALNLNS